MEYERRANCALFAVVGFAAIKGLDAEAIGFSLGFPRFLVRKRGDLPMGREDVFCVQVNLASEI